MSKLKFDQVGERLYETGVDHGVLYPLNTKTTKYDRGVAWNGLTSVQETPSGAESNPLYADNIKYLDLRSAEEFGATIEAYMYPDEFAELDGTAALAKGVTIGQQKRGIFGLCYEKIIDMLPEIKDSGAMFSVRATLLSSWIDQLFPAISYLDSLDLQNVHILPNLWEEWGNAEAAELRYQLSKYEEYLIENFRANQHPIVFSDYAQGFWRITASISAKARRINRACLPEARCGMGVRGSCSIDPNGDNDR